MTDAAPAYTPDQTVCYATPAGIELTMDVFRPRTDPSPTGFPGVMMVHGGGWRTGKPTQLHWLAADAAARGYVAASIAYRLSDAATWPAPLHDCQAAMRFMREQAKAWQMDASRLGVVGSSAGGHLAACLGVSDAPQAGVSSRATCVVDIHGIHDFPHLAHVGMLLEASTRLLGGAYHEQPARWDDASPIRRVDRDAAPTLLLHDPDDRTVPYEQSVRFAEALMRHHRPVEFLPTPGSGHGFIYNTDNPHAQAVLPMIRHWLDRHLRPHPAARGR